PCGRPATPPIPQVTPSPQLHPSPDFRKDLALAERSAARLAHQSGGLGVASSNLAAPTSTIQFLAQIAEYSGHQLGVKSSCRGTPPRVAHSSITSRSTIHLGGWTTMVTMIATVTDCRSFWREIVVPYYN